MLVATLAAKECGVYLAPSTIPGAGLGMYAGNNAYEKGDMVTLGDVVVPVFEMDWHMGHESYDFLWEEYVWSFSQFTGKPKSAFPLALGETLGHFRDTRGGCRLVILQSLHPFTGFMFSLLQGWIRK
jgi:hypothetical protein